MTKSDVIKRLKEMKKAISHDFGCSSDRVNDIYYSLLADIENEYGDIIDERLIEDNETD